MKHSAKRTTASILALIILVSAFFAGAPVLTFGAAASYIPTGSDFANPGWWGADAYTAVAGANGIDVSFPNSLGWGTRYEGQKNLELDGLHLKLANLSMAGYVNESSYGQLMIMVSDAATNPGWILSANSLMMELRPTATGSVLNVYRRAEGLLLASLASDLPVASTNDIFFMKRSGSWTVIWNGTSAALNGSDIDAELPATGVVRLGFVYGQSTTGISFRIAELTQNTPPSAYVPVATDFANPGWWGADAYGATAGADGIAMEFPDTLGWGVRYEGRKNLAVAGLHVKLTEMAMAPFVSESSYGQLMMMLSDAATNGGGDPSGNGLMLELRPTSGGSVLNVYRRPEGTLLASLPSTQPVASVHDIDIIPGAVRSMIVWNGVTRTIDNADIVAELPNLTSVRFGFVYGQSSTGMLFKIAELTENNIPVLVVEETTPTPTTAATPTTAPTAGPTSAPYVPIARPSVAPYVPVPADYINPFWLGDPLPFSIVGVGADGLEFNFPGTTSAWGMRAIGQLNQDLDGMNIKLEDIQLDAPNGMLLLGIGDTVKNQAVDPMSKGLLLVFRNLPDGNSEMIVFGRPEETIDGVLSFSGPITDSLDIFIYKKDSVWYFDVSGISSTPVLPTALPSAIRMIGPDAVSIPDVTLLVKIPNPTSVRTCFGYGAGSLVHVRLASITDLVVPAENPATGDNNAPAILLVLAALAAAFLILGSRRRQDAR